MAKQKHKNSKAVEEDDEEEMTGLDATCSERTFETENLKVLGGVGHLTPEGVSSRLLPSEKQVELDSCHTVTCMFTVSLAVPALPAGQKRKKSDTPDRRGKRIQADESGDIPKMQRYYHIEYSLLPDDLKPRKVDLVLFGVAAKLFAESGSKAVTPWFENGKMWISWNHSIDISVTTDYLIKLRDHKIILKIWDTKDKVSSKAKQSRPSISSSLEGDEEAVGGVKHAVLLQRKEFEESQPAPSCTKIKAAKESKAQGESSALPVEEETDLSGLATSHCGLPRPSGTNDLHMVRKIQTLKLVPQGSHSVSKNPTGDSTRSVIAVKNRFLDKQKAVAGAPVDSASKGTEKANGNVGILTYKPDKTATMNGRRGSGPRGNIDATVAKKRGIASLQLELMPLLSGEKSVMSRLAENNPKVLDAYVTFTVKTPLLSERQRHELNPLVIRINSAKCLPNTPVPIEVLQRLCVPTYCKYKFHNFPPHQTHGQIHGTDVYFKDVNVLLTGTMKPGELQSYLRGPPLEIEVHDRDRNMEDNTRKPCLFGEDEADDKVGRVSFLASKPTICNSFIKNEVWQPHGVAKVSLTELLLGKKYLTISAPIQNCSAPISAAFREKDKKEKIAESRSSSSLLPMGHYLESGSVLKVRVEIAVPLGMRAEIADAQVSDCPYGCIIYIFDYNNSSLLHDLVEEITEVNAKALQLDCCPVHLVRMDLAALKLKTTLEKVSKLDIITGFHLSDGAVHVFVLEGLKDKAIKKIWDKHFERTCRHEDGQLEILYNSQLSFHQRLYTDLEAIFYHFRLCKPLFTTRKQPLLYVRGMVPWACFQALSRLSYLCHSKRLEDVIHGDLLPSAEMIRVFSHEYGVSLTDEDLFPQKPPLLLVSSDDYTAPGKVSRVKQAVYPSLDNYNERCVQRKKETADKMSSERNHIRANIAVVCQLKGKRKKPEFEVFRISPVDGKSVFNYSSQSLNSAELAKKHLCREMAKEPKKRFTYCHEYLSASFDPVDVVSACKESFAKSRSMWLSPDGFVFPGFKSSIESNLHPQMPHQARREELSEKWQENALHANMEPVLSRDRWSWDKRHVDFDLYKKPPELFVTAAPQTDAKQILQTTCDDTKLEAHQCSIAAELSTHGRHPSFQLQKLRGHVKDGPQGSSLRKAGPVLKPVPALSALDKQPCDAGKRRKSLIPGPDDRPSFRCHKDVLPGTTQSVRSLKNSKVQTASYSTINMICLQERDQSARAGGCSTTPPQQEDPLQNDKPDRSYARYSHSVSGMTPSLNAA